MEKEYEETKPSNKPDWKGFFIYAILLAVSVIALYPSMYEQSLLLLEIYEIEQLTATQMTLLNMIQPFIIGMGAILVGHFFAYRVNLRSLTYEKLNENRNIYPSLKDSFLPAITVGILFAIIAVGFDIVFRPLLPEMLQLPVSMPTIEHTIGNIFYGGIAEEFMLRWGLMTIAVYVFSLKGKYLNKWVYIVSIVFSAIVFALGHYGSTATYFDMTAIIWIRMLVLNGFGGLIFGWLFWKYHLEAAMISHILTHITMTLLSVVLATLGV